MPAITGVNYVLNIYIHKIMVQKHVCCIDENHETCVSFKLFEEIVFEVFQPNDPRQSNACACVIRFEKGKTCLFSMTAAMAKNAKNTKLFMEVYQKMSCACLPSKLELGTLEIDMEEQFTRVNAGEMVKPIKGYYSVKNKENDEVAVIDMMLRLSKLNDINLNDFTMSEGSSNFTVKGTDDPNAYMFKRANAQRPPQNSCDPAKMMRDVGEVCCSHEMSHGPCCDGSGGAAGAMPMDMGGGCGGGGLGGYAGGMPPRVDTDAGCGCYVKPKEPNNSDYEEIAATLNGNQIKIRVPKSMRGSPSLLTCNQAGDNAAAGTAERTMVFGDNEVVLSMKQGGQGGQGIGGQGQGERGSAQDKPGGFTTQFSTRGDPNAGKPTMTITPNNVPQGVEAMKVMDENKDVFLLRINKKCRTADKANLELELVTPKPPEKPPKPQSETRNTQYDEADIPPPTPPLEPEPEIIPFVSEDEGKGKKKDKKGKKGKKDKKDKKKKGKK